MSDAFRNELEFLGIELPAFGVCAEDFDRRLAGELSDGRKPYRRASVCRLARACSLNLGNVDPAHGHHGVHRPLGGDSIRILQRGN
jgi:hypothetical protein